jgi:hypothetical protein
MGDYYHSSSSWIRQSDPLDAVLDKIKGVHHSTLQQDRKKIISKLKKSKYDFKADLAVIPTIFETMYKKITENVGKKIGKHSGDTIDILFKTLKDAEEKLKKADKTLSKIKPYKNNLPRIFDIDDGRYTFVNPLNYFMYDWKYDDKLSKNVIQSTYTHLYGEYLRPYSDDQREALGCESDGVPTESHRTHDSIVPGEERRMIAKKNIAFDDSDTSTILEHVGSQINYPCKKLIQRMTPFISSRVIDLTIPSITPLYVEPSTGESLCSFINEIFFQRTSSVISINKYFPDLKIPSLTFSVTNDLETQYNYINLALSSNGKIVTGDKYERCTIVPEVIGLYNNTTVNNADTDGKDIKSNLYLTGNLFRLFPDEKSTLGKELGSTIKSTSTEKIAEKRDNLYNNGMSEKVLKRFQLKFGEKSDNISIQKIRNVVLVLYSIYTKSGLDYHLIHKDNDAELINRKIAKELLYLALFTFYNYLEHVLFKSIIKSINESKLSKNLKKNIKKYFTNVLGLLRTNTVILFGYTKLKNIKENYGIKRGQTNTIVSDDKKGEYFRLEDGYNNSKLDEGEKLENFKKHFPFKIDGSSNTSQIVVGKYESTGTATPKEDTVFFTYDSKPVPHPVIENETFSKDPKIQDFRMNRDLYLVNKKPNREEGLEINLENNIGKVYYIHDGAKREIPKNKTGYSKFEITSTELPKHSFTIYDMDKSSAKQMAVFLTGTTKSTKDIVSGEKLGFGVLPFGVDEVLPKRNEILFEIYEQYSMNFLAQIEKNIIYLRLLIYQLETGIHVDYIRDNWFVQFKNDLENIGKAHLPEDKKKMFKKLMEDHIIPIQDGLLNKLKDALIELINYDYDVKINKKNVTTDKYELMIKLRIKHNEITLLRRIIELSYREAVKDIVAGGIPIQQVESTDLPESFLVNIMKILDMAEKQFIEDKVKTDEEIRKKSLDIGEGKEFVSFYEKVLDEGLDLESYSKQHSSILALDDREYSKKLLVLDLTPTKGKNVCTLGSLFSFPQITRAYVEFMTRTKYKDLLYNSVNRITLWNPILQSIDPKHGNTNIMIPVSGGLIGGYVLLDVGNFLKETSSHTPKYTKFSDFTESNLTKHVMKSYHKIILVNYDSNNMIDKKAWGAISRKDVDKVVKTGSSARRYKFISDLLLDPTEYKKMTYLMNGGMLINNISLKYKIPDYITSFRCLASKLIKMIELKSI